MGRLSTNFMFKRRQTSTEYKKKDARVEMSESWRLPNAMTSVERDQLLLTTPEVSFEIVFSTSCFLCAIDRHCCVIIPVSFPRCRLHGYKATKLNG